ncbi:helix-turn-helix domain-containing protein [Arthrobacter globiformis]|uniref:helix-turn-helix domain-containing protein n=1 Tax=Arthrobacter globiformis TaxID=1665 RepID=UPI000B416C79|nr:helix-turn-helix transcriptional regulator [Arthrobacter globiformis]
MTPEQKVAATIVRHRKEKDLTYEQLAERMALEGVNIHQSAIQKTEKSGRRVNIDEMVAYAKVFGIPVEALWGGTGQEAEVAAGWQALLGAETLHTIAAFARRNYEDEIARVRAKAEKNPELREHIEARLAKHRVMAERKARAMADKDGIDVSTDAKFEEYLWKWHADDAMQAAHDVLAGLGNGK